jgi:hypothetical protein
MYFFGSTKYDGEVEVDTLDYRRAVAGHRCFCGIYRESWWALPDLQCLEFLELSAVDREHGVYHRTRRAAGSRSSGVNERSAKVQGLAQDGPGTASTGAIRNLAPIKLRAAERAPNACSKREQFRAVPLRQWRCRPFDDLK